MERDRLLRSCAVAGATVGGVAWVVKGGAILVGLDQPPLLLDVGVAAFPVTLVCLAASAHRRASLALGVVSLVTGWLALASEVAGTDQGPTILVSSLALVLGLALLGGEDPELRAARALGLLTVPVILASGLLALVAERLIELSTVLLGLAWLLLGLALAGDPYARALRGFRGLGRTTSTGHGA
jgi:hypothetical protein